MESTHKNAFREQKRTKKKKNKLKIYLCMYAIDKGNILTEWVEKRIRRIKTWPIEWYITLVYGFRFPIFLLMDTSVRSVFNGEFFDWFLFGFGHGFYGSPTCHLFTRTKCHRLLCVCVCFVGGIVAILWIIFFFSASSFLSFTEFSFTFFLSCLQWAVNEIGPLQNSIRQCGWWSMFEGKKKQLFWLVKWEKSMWWTVEGIKN